MFRSVSMLGVVLGCLFASSCYLSAEFKEPIPPPPLLPNEIATDDPFASYENVALLTVARESARAEAIIVFRGTPAGSSEPLVLVTWFDGRRFTPAVPLGGFGSEAIETGAGIDVVFLQTERFAGANREATERGRARNGDALISYSATDASRSAAYVYLTRFDRSAVGNPDAFVDASGFSRLPVRMSSGTSLGRATRIRWVSDSFDGPFDRGMDCQVSIRRSGRPTSSLGLSYSDLDDSFNARQHLITFDIGGVGDASAVVASPGDGLLQASGQNGAPLTADGFPTTYGNCLFWGARDLATDGKDYRLLASCVDGSQVKTLSLGSDPMTTGGIAESPDAIYGPPDGLASFYVSFVERGFGGVADGERTLDADQMIARLAPDASSRVLVEADAFRDPVDARDLDADGDLRRSGSTGGVAFRQSVMSADRKLLYLATTQLATEATDANDADPSVGSPATNYVVYLRALRLDSRTGSLEDGLSNVLVVPSMPSSGDIRSGQHIAQNGITSFEFQRGNAAESWQRSSDRIHFTYVQSGDVASTDLDEWYRYRLFFNGISVTTPSGGKPAIQLLAPSLDASTVPMPWKQIDVKNFGPAIIDRTSESDVPRVAFYAVESDPITGQVFGTRALIWDGNSSRVLESPSSPLAQPWTSDDAVAVVRSSGMAHMIWRGVEKWESPYVPSRPTFARTLVRGVASTETVPSFDAPPASTEMLGPSQFSDWSQCRTGAASGSGLISGSRVALVAHTDHDVLMMATSTDLEHMETGAPSCVDCDSSIVREILVVPGKPVDMIPSALVFVERVDADFRTTVGVHVIH